MTNRRLVRWVAVVIGVWTVAALLAWQLVFRGGSDRRILCQLDGNPCHLPVASEAGAVWAAGVIGFLIVALVARWWTHRNA